MVWCVPSARSCRPSALQLTRRPADTIPENSRMNTRSIAVMVASVAALTACAGLRDALSAHVDVVARAGDAELTVTHLAELMGNSPIRPPVTRDVAHVITNLWTDYHLL